MDVVSIVEREEQQEAGLRYIYLRGSAQPTKLIVCFGAMGKGFYSRLSWYWREDGDYRDAYLFLVDPLNSYYLGLSNCDLRPAYRQLISMALEKSRVDAAQMIMVGNSMGGYAALRYGQEFCAGAVVVGNPQVSMRAAEGGPPTWLRCMRSAHFFEDLPLTTGRIKRTRIIVGSFAADIAAAQQYQAAARKRGAFVEVDKKNIADHHIVFPSKRDIEDVLAGEEVA